MGRGGNCRRNEDFNTPLTVRRNSGRRSSSSSSHRKNQRPPSPSNPFDQYPLSNSTQSLPRTRQNSSSPGLRQFRKMHTPPSYPSTSQPNTTKVEQKLQQQQHLMKNVHDDLIPDSHHDEMGLDYDRTNQIQKISDFQSMQQASIQFRQESICFDKNMNNKSKQRKWWNVFNCGIYNQHLVE